MKTKLKLVTKNKYKKETVRNNKEKAYFICKEHRVVERLNPHVLIKEPPLLGSDALINVLLRKADAVGEVTKGLFNVHHPSPCIDHWIEARVSSTESFSTRIYHDASFLDFDESITTFFSSLSFLLLIRSGLFPLILLRWRRGAEGLW